MAKILWDNLTAFLYALLKALQPPKSAREQNMKLIILCGLALSHPEIHSHCVFPCVNRWAEFKKI